MEELLERGSEDICNGILEILSNKEVSVETDTSSRSSVYVFLNNTIYISNMSKKNKSRDEQNKSRLLVIAHECVHSIQPKLVQLLNFILSNIEMILFTLLIVLKIFTKCSLYVLTVGYVVTVLSVIVIRLYLELNATVNSVKLVSKYLSQNKVEKNKIIELQKYYKKELLKTLPGFITYLFAFKIIRLVIAMII